MYVNIINGGRFQIMKKLSTILLIALLTMLFVLPVSAIDWYSDQIANVFDTLPAQFANATVIQFGDQYTEGATNARHGNASGNGNDFDYIYLKADDLGDFSVKFTVPEDGLYEFGFTLMGWTASVLRTTNVKIDDAPFVYIAYDYTEADQHRNHYWYGISAVLTAGEHTMTLSLSDDFDDSAVKSLYFDNFFYVKGELPAVEEVTAEVTETPTPVIETVTQPTPKAPATFDGFAIATVLLTLSVSGGVVLKKRK